MDLKNIIRNRRIRGMATIETALALPTVFLVFVALADFSVAFQDFLAANHAAEVGVRSASLSLGNDCQTNDIEDIGGNAAAQALAQAGVIDPTGVSSYAGTVSVQNLDDPSNCAAGLLQIDVPMVLSFPYLQSMIDPIVPGSFSLPVDYTVRAVAQNENRN